MTRQLGSLGDSISAGLLVEPPVDDIKNAINEITWEEEYIVNSHKR